MLKGKPSHLDCAACVGSCIHFCCHTQCLHVLLRCWRYLQEASKPQGIAAVGDSIVCQRIWGLSLGLRLLSPLERKNAKYISSVMYSQYGTSPQYLLFLSGLRPGEETWMCRHCRMRYELLRMSIPCIFLPYKNTGQSWTRCWCRVREQKWHTSSVKAQVDCLF